MPSQATPERCCSHILPGFFIAPQDLSPFVSISRRASRCCTSVLSMAFKRGPDT